MQTVFLGIGAVQLAGYGLSGLITGPRLHLALWAAPAGGLGLFLGQTIFRRLPEDRFRRSVRAGLAAMGLWFLVRALA